MARQGEVSRTAPVMGKAGSMPAGGMTVAVSYGGSEGTDDEVMR